MTIIEDYINSLPVNYYYYKIIGNGNIDPNNYISVRDYRKDIIRQITANIDLDFERCLFFEETSSYILPEDCINMLNIIINSDMMNYHIENIFTINKNIR